MLKCTLAWTTCIGWKGGNTISVLKVQMFEERMNYVKGLLKEEVTDIKQNSLTVWNLFIEPTKTLYNKYVRSVWELPLILLSIKVQNF